jgi:hypothetical protein
MPLGHRVSKDVLERHAADKKLAATYREALEAVAAADGALRGAQGEDGRSGAELRGLSVALDRALGDALRVAEAAERAAMGVQTYVPEGANTKGVRDAEIARRRAKARPGVREWTDEVDRLRTARERHVLSFRVAGARSGA